MNALAVAPVLVPLVTAAVTALLGRRPRAQVVLSFLGAAAFLATSIVVLAHAAADDPVGAAFGGWIAPYGIEFHLDRLGSALVVVTALMGLATLVFLMSDADPGPRAPYVLPMVHGLLAGVAGAFSTADLFNLYVWFEVVLICALGLLALGSRLDQQDASFKYLVLNLLGTLLLLMAVGCIYAATGHLNFTALSQSGLGTGTLVVLLTPLLLAFLIKGAAFPLYAWLPASYHTLPGPILALFAGLLTKVGLYAVMRVVGDVFAPSPEILTEVLGWVAVATMLFGVLGAAYHWDMRRILAFHIVSQIGYIMLAVALSGTGGNTAALFYIVHHIIVKANLFLIAAMIWRLTGSYDLRRIGGLAKARPALAFVFMVPALSLIGIPPFSGFWSKLLLLQETVSQGRYVWTGMALLISVFTLYSVMKIWKEAFWKTHPDESWTLPTDTRLGPAWIATIGLGLVTLAISINPQALLGFARAAAKTLGGG